MKAVVSKLHCSSMEEVMVVRRRPHVVNGGGFVVTDCKENIVFKIDGCGVLGTKGELVLRDGDGNDLLLINKKVSLSFFFFYPNHLIIIPNLVW